MSYKHYSNQYLKETVYGGIDGIVTTFAVVSGFAGASHMLSDIKYPLVVVLLFGLANLFADASSMGLGEYLSTRSESKLYHSEYVKVSSDIISDQKKKQDESMTVLQEQGFSTEDAQIQLDIYARYPDMWAQFLLQYQYEIDMPEDHPALGALATFFAFLVFGTIPLLPYLLFLQSPYVFVASIVFTLFALVLLGVLRARVTREVLWKSIAEVTAIGVLAASVAYVVGLCF